MIPAIPPVELLKDVAADVGNINGGGPVWNPEIVFVLVLNVAKLFAGGFAFVWALALALAFCNFCCCC